MAGPSIPKLCVSRVGYRKILVSEVKVKTYTISEWRCKQGWGKPPPQGLFSPGAKGQSQAYQSFPGSLGKELVPGSPRPSSDTYHYERKGYGKLV